MTLPTITMDSLRNASIRARYAYAATCAFDAIRTLGPITPPIRDFFEVVWSFVELHNLSVWEERLQRPAARVAYLDGTGIATCPGFEHLPQYVAEMCSWLFDVAESNLYTEDSERTIDGVQALLVLAVEHGHELPPISILGVEARNGSKLNSVLPRTRFDPTVPDGDEWVQWSRDAVALTTQRNQEWTAQLGDRPKYHWDLDSGVLTVTDGSIVIAADIAVVGTVARSDNSFCWSWANGSIPNALSAPLVLVHEFGHAHDLPLLFNRIASGGHAQGLELAAVAARILDAPGTFSDTLEESHIYFALRSFR